MEIFSKVSRTKLPEMKVVAAKRISENPEEEVIEFLCGWLQSRGFDLETRRGFGFDVPVSDEELSGGQRGYEYWITLDEEVEGDEQVRVMTIAADDYAFMRVCEPFAEPFERIGNGWRILAGEAVKLQEAEGEMSYKNRYCLEEVIIEGEATFMDLYCPV